MCVEECRFRCMRLVGIGSSGWMRGLVLEVVLGRWISRVAEEER